jgi:protein ImuB
VRTACLRVPELPLAAELRAHPELAERPFAVASGPGPRAELVAVSAEAARQGVRRLTSVAHARAICGDLRVRVASPALERAARAALLDAALSFSPRASLAPRAPGAYAAEAAVILDASGARPEAAQRGAAERSRTARPKAAQRAEGERRWAPAGARPEAAQRATGERSSNGQASEVELSERGWATALVARAERLGLPAAVAVASSRSVAHLAARQLPSGDSLVLPPGSETAFLAPLPIDLLDPDDTLAEALTRFGVRTVRDLLTLPRRGLAARLGPSALQLIARVRGEETEVPPPLPAAGRLAEAIDLEFPIDRLEPLVFALRGLLSRLRDRLEARRLACSDLFLTLDLEGGERDARRIGVATPTLDLRVLVRQARHALETRPPAAPVVGAALESEGRPARTDQLDLFRPPGPHPAVLGRTLAELESLCGSGRLGAPQAADDHRPDAFGLHPFQPGRAVAQRPTAEFAEPPRTPLAVRALRPPAPARVSVIRGRPERIRSAVANGEVVRLAGPWRTTGSWWSREQRFAYDSFDVQTGDGVVARLRFDHIRKVWHIDAVYD